MRYIAVPTDFSENAYNALLYATRLFPNQEYTIILIHSYETEFSTSTSRIDIGRNEELYLEIEQRVSKNFEALTHKIARDTEGLHVSFETLMTGFPLFKCIYKLQEEKPVSLIVMGTKGATGIRQLFMGSQTIRLIKKIYKLPVIVVPENADFTPPKIIAIATDFKTAIHTHAITTLKDIATSNDAVIKITHIYDQKNPEDVFETNYKKIKKSLSDIEYTTHWLSNTSKKENVLNEFVKKMNVDLLVLTYHKHSMLQKLFKENIVENIGFHTSIPLLVFTNTD
ncbi:universal stress protein [uncultured Dokdonia sp.]|uniref:universal stress protein n=1 Tax=uncultured Dokdonia sp. TaxID=575653 RepID=UPI0026032FA2|nr:universal stress protein [uncultured Dokdonia sp.]